MVSRLAWLQDELLALEQRGLRRNRRTIRPLPEGWCEVDGDRVRNFAGNDYLDLAGHPDVLALAESALRDAGAGSRGSALVCGRGPWHERLEQRIASFEGTESAVLFPTGLAANVGTIQALSGPEDVLFCDRWNHASLIDGCRLSGASLRVYRHDDLAGLERALEKSSTARRRFVITDAVFSMEGDLAPLSELCRLTEQYQALLLVDEAHATGVFGARGRGVCEALGVEDRVDVRTGTLSKGLGSLGGFVSGSRVLVELLWNTARTQMFSTALPPAACGAAIAAFDLLQREPERLQRLAELCRLFRSALAERGVAAWPGSQGPIVPVVIGDPVRAVEIAGRLQRRGFLVGAIRPPTVPQGTARLRISISLAHEPVTLGRLATAVAEEIRNEPAFEWPSP